MIVGLLLFVLDLWCKQSLPSQLSPAPLANPYVAVAMVVAIGVVWVAVIKKNVTRTGAIWITLGTISNMVDGMRFHGVIDYLPFGSHATNLSDLLIIAGCLLCAVELFRPTKPTTRPLSQ